MTATISLITIVLVCAESWAFTSDSLVGDSSEPSVRLSQVPDDLIPQATFPGPCRALIDGFPGYSLDGVVDRERVYSYDESGNLIGIERDLLRHSYSYDESGRLAGEETYLYGSGCFRRVAYNYGSDGMMRMAERDSDCDGTIDSHELVEYDERNQPVTRVVVAYPEGTIRSHTVLEYDESGRLIEEEVDYVMVEGDVVDNQIDMRISYELDDHGRTVSKESDLDADGVVDQVESFTYSETGALLTVRLNQDSEYFGFFGHSSFSFEYDELGNLVVVEECGDGGQIVARTEYDYSCFASSED